MSRLSAPPLETLSPRQAEVYREVAAGPRGGVRGPIAVWLHSAEIADKAQALGRVCRYETSLPPRLSELAILVVAAYWESEYEWAAHCPLALKAGIDPEIAAAIKAHNRPTFVHSDEAVVHDTVFELQAQRRISDALYEKARATLGEQALVELVAIAGYYTLISMTLNVFEISA